MCESNEHVLSKKIVHRLFGWDGVIVKNLVEGISGRDFIAIFDIDGKRTEMKVHAEEIDIDGKKSELHDWPFERELILVKKKNEIMRNTLSRIMEEPKECMRIAKAGLDIEFSVEAQEPEEL